MYIIRVQDAPGTSQRAFLVETAAQAACPAGASTNRQGYVAKTWKLVMTSSFTCSSADLNLTSARTGA